MKTFVSNTAIYSVNQNTDGTLSIIREYFYKNTKWNKDGSPIQNAGMFIMQQGGISGLLSKCIEDDDLDAYVAKRNKELTEAHARLHEKVLERQERREREIKENYERIFCNEITETTAESVEALLLYLNTMNWGRWDLPKMTIGYACHQYDCDGKTATTIKLDRPIIVNDEPGTMFQVGAPHGHLMKYRRI